MTIYVVRTSFDCWVTTSEEEAEFKADKLYDLLEDEYEEYRISIVDLWARIDIYHALDKLGSPFIYKESRWVNKM